MIRWNAFSSGSTASKFIYELLGGERDDRKYETDMMRSSLSLSTTTMRRVRRGFGHKNAAGNRCGSGSIFTIGISNMLMAAQAYGN